MKVLVTAGNTRVPIDKVRCISNIFKGATGTRIAVDLLKAGHEVTLVANPNSTAKLRGLLSQETEEGFHSYTLDTPRLETSKREPNQGWMRRGHTDYKIRAYEYDTYDELRDIMGELIGERTDGEFDVIIHSAAVSDYKPVDVMVDADEASPWLMLRSVMKDKVKSDHNELYIKLEKTEKLVDKIRSEWGFRGKLVKFKLEVSVTDQELIDIAKRSREHSGADFIVANSLEFFKDWKTQQMYIIGESSLDKTSREELSTKLLSLLGS